MWLRGFAGIIFIVIFLLANFIFQPQKTSKQVPCERSSYHSFFMKLWRLITVKNLKFGTPQTIAIIVLKIEKFDVTLH